MGTAPEKRQRRALYREPSYVLLLVGILLASFGISSLVNGHHPVISIVLAVLGLSLLIPMRVLRSRSGRWP